MILNIALFFIIKCLVTIASELQEYKIELVQALFRHGDRTPDNSEIYLIKEFNESIYEPYGLGQLTNVGKRRAYKIGQVLRERYDDFLGDTYRPEFVYAYTTNTDRTKMTLQLALASLYPPNNLLEWNEKLHWIPIPIMYNNTESDIFSIFKICFKKAEFGNKLKKLFEIVEKTPKYNKTFEYVMNLFNSKKTLYVHTMHLYNIIQSHKSIGLPFPKGFTEEHYQDLEELADFFFELTSSTSEFKVHVAGSMIQKFIDNINKKENKNDLRKIYLYSAHDFNVSPFLQAHNLTIFKKCSYGTAVIFEKLRGPNNDIFVRLLLWTGVEEKLVPLKLNDCLEICPWSKYLDIVKPILPQEINTVTCNHNPMPLKCNGKVYLSKARDFEIITA